MDWQHDAAPTWTRSSAKTPLFAFRSLFTGSTGLTHSDGQFTRSSRGVIVLGYTFVATAGTDVRRDVLPKFADVDPKTYTLDPDSLGDQGTPDTVGVVVHFAGHPMDFGELLPVIDEYSHLSQWPLTSYSSLPYIETWEDADRYAL